MRKPNNISSAGIRRAFTLMQVVVAVTVVGMTATATVQYPSCSWRE